ncbi:MAG TPA: TIGR03564 family F420-dependent LLM class oxidoreductase [Acidimicrobiales bacterium]|nr:TIGR03564 family F420-dependent LLM class oxidoreductase [Acidimicrobiales bacterium]
MEISLGAGGATLDQVVDQARAAADDGFAGVYLANIFGLDAMTACAVVGREVPGIQLGTAVVPTYPRHPHAMAQQAATTHAACGGRFVLGIGLSHQIVIESMFGMSFDKPAKHMREYLSVLMPLLREGKVSFAGDVYTVNAPLEGVLDDGPPVVLAALAPRMLELAGSMADGTALWMTGPKTIADHIVPSITKAADNAGRPAPQIHAALPVCVTNDADAARTTAAKEFAVYGTLPSYRAMLDKEGADGPADVAIVGDEATVQAGVNRLRDAGVTNFAAGIFGSDEERAATKAALKALL